MAQEKTLGSSDQAHTIKSAAKTFQTRRKASISRKPKATAAKTILASQDPDSGQPYIEESPAEFGPDTPIDDIANAEAKGAGEDAPGVPVESRAKSKKSRETSDDLGNDSGNGDGDSGDVDAVNPLDDDEVAASDNDTWSFEEDMPEVPPQYDYEQTAIEMGKASKDAYIAANPEMFAEPTFVEVTPAIASQLFLKRAPQQRNISNPHVRFLSRQMSEGHWSFNGDTIRLNLKGELLDGQHRCLAVVDSGYTMNAVIVTVSDKSFETIDTGNRARGIGELFRMNGEANATKLAAALACMAEVDGGRKPYAAAGGKARLSPLELQGTLERHPAIRESCQWLAKMPRPLGPISMYACIHYLFWRVNPVEADRFFEDLISGAGMGAQDPVFVLREKLMLEHASRLKSTKFDKYSWFVYAWNARRRGATLNRIRSAGIGENPEIL